MPMLLRHQVRALRIDYEAYAHEAKDLALEYIEKGGAVGPTRLIHDLLFSAVRNEVIAKMLLDWENRIP